MQGNTKKQGRKRNPDDLIRENDFLKYKMRDLQKYIRKLEYDNAELQRWANDICLPKLSELSDELAMRYNQKKYRQRNWKNELPRV